MAFSACASVSRTQVWLSRTRGHGVTWRRMRVAEGLRWVHTQAVPLTSSIITFGEVPNGSVPQCPHLGVIVKERPHVRCLERGRAGKRSRERGCCYNYSMLLFSGTQSPELGGGIGVR